MAKFPAGQYVHKGAAPGCAVSSISWAGSDRQPRCHECGRPMVKRDRPTGGRKLRTVRDGNRTVNVYVKGATKGA